MKNLVSLFTVFALFATSSFASSTRLLTADQVLSSDLSKTFSFPAATDTLVGRASTDTLTNKTLSGSSNTFTAIPVGAIGNGSVLSGSNTGDVTLGTANGLSLTGQALSLGTASTSTTGALTSTDWNTFQGKQAAGNYITALTGDVTASGPGSSTATLATVNSNVGSFTNANITVNAKGLITAASNGSSTSPALNGGSASPESIIAATGITLSSIGYMNEVWVVGTAIAVTVTATPSITACTADGQQLKVHGTDNTKTVTLQDQSNLASSGLSMNGNVVLAKDSTISFHCDITQGLWVEDSRR